MKRTRLETECFPIIGKDRDGGRIKAFIHADRDPETGALVDIRMTTNTRQAPVMHNFLEAASDRIGKEIRRKA